MEALILILIGVIAGIEIGGGVSTRTQIDPTNASTNDGVIECIAAPDAIRIANLEDPDAPLWMLQQDQSLCNSATGQVVVIRNLNN